MLLGEERKGVIEGNRRRGCCASLLLPPYRSSLATWARSVYDSVQLDTTVDSSHELLISSSFREISQGVGVGQNGLRVQTTYITPQYVFISEKFPKRSGFDKLVDNPHYVYNSSHLHLREISQAVGVRKKWLVVQTTHITPQYIFICEKFARRSGFDKAVDSPDSCRYVTIYLHSEKFPRGLGLG